MPNRTDEEVKARSFGWKKYTFRYRNHAGHIITRDVYAADDEAAAHVFNMAYGRHVKEVIS